MPSKCSKENYQKYVANQKFLKISFKKSELLVYRFLKNRESKTYFRALKLQQISLEKLYFAFRINENLISL